MVLITWALFTKIFYPDQLKQFKNRLISKSNNRDLYRKSVLLNVLWFCLICVIFMLNMIPAILISKECHNNNICSLVLAFLFSDIYVFHYALRKFVYRDSYCKV